MSKSFMLTLLVFLVAIPLLAQPNPAGTCSVATLKGMYGAFAEGTILAPFPGFPPPPYAGVVAGLHSYDGEGNVKVSYAASFGGVIIPWGATATGTYSVNRDCTISVSVMANGGLPANFVGTITGSGMTQEVHIMYTDGYWVNSGTLRRTPHGICTQETLKSTYALFGQGLGSVPGFPPMLPGAHAGMIIADGHGNLAGKETVNLAGTSGSDTFTGSYTVSADCVLTMTINASLGVFHLVGTITGEGSSQEVHTIFTNSGWVFADTDEKQ